MLLFSLIDRRQILNLDSTISFAGICIFTIQPRFEFLLRFLNIFCMAYIFYMSVQFRKLFSGKNDIMSFQSPACECLQFQQHGNKEPGMGSNNAVLSAIVTSPELISFVGAFRARSEGLPRVLQGLKPWR